MITGQEGENPIKRITGWEALTFCFSPLPLLSPAFRHIPGAALKRMTRRRKHSNHIDTTQFLQQAIEIFLFYSHLNSGEFGNSDNLRSMQSAFVCVCFQLGSDLMSWKTYHHAAFKQGSKLEYLSHGQDPLLTPPIWKCRGCDPN